MNAGTSFLGKGNCLNVPLWLRLCQHTFLVCPPSVHDQILSCIDRNSRRSAEKMSQNDLLDNVDCMLHAPCIWVLAIPREDWLDPPVLDPFSLAYIEQAYFCEGIWIEVIAELTDIYVTFYFQLFFSSAHCSPLCLISVDSLIIRGSLCTFSSRRTDLPQNIAFSSVLSSATNKTNFIVSSLYTDCARLRLL